MTVYCGVDFHARQQTICYCDSAGGEIRLAEQDRERDDVSGFYSAFAGACQASRRHEDTACLKPTVVGSRKIILLDGIHRFLQRRAEKMFARHSPGPRCYNPARPFPTDDPTGRPGARALPPHAVSHGVPDARAFN